jgi:hypothetical protein
VAVVAGLVGKAAGGDGRCEEFRMTPGKVEGVLVIAITEAEGDIGDARWRALLLEADLA